MYICIRSIQVCIYFVCVLRQRESVTSTGHITCVLLFLRLRHRRDVIPSWPTAVYDVSCLLDSRQLTSLLLRWTKADALGDDDGGEHSVMTEDATATTHVAAKKKAALVAAGLKTVKVVCIKADNNKGELLY